MDKVKHLICGPVAVLQQASSLSWGPEDLGFVYETGAHWLWDCFFWCSRTSPHPTCCSPLGLLWRNVSYTALPLGSVLSWPV